MSLWDSYTYKIKCFSPVNLSYVNLIIMLAKEPEGKKGTFFLYNTYMPQQVHALNTYPQMLTCRLFPMNHLSSSQSCEL